MRLPLLLLLFATTACAADPVSYEFAPDDPEIALLTTASAYTWTRLAEDGVNATLVNRSNSPFYARIGDGFSGPVQENLYIATGTDAVFQREVAPGTWVTVEVGTLIEGSRTIVLAGGGQFALSGVPTNHVDGTYRIRLRYYAAPDRSGTAREAVSPGFTIR